MRLTHNGDRRWNRLVGFGIAIFAVWILLVVLSSIFGRNKEVGDDALLIGAAAGFLTVLLGQIRHDEKIDHNAGAMADLEAKIDRLLALWDGEA